MMKEKLAVFLLLLSLEYSNAQGGSGYDTKSISVYNDEDGNKVTRMEREAVGTRFVETREYKGNVFLDDKFQLGRITLDGGKIIEDSLVYNIMTNEIIAKIDNKPVTLKNINFTLGNKQFISLKNRTFELLHGSLLEDKKIKILKEYACRLDENTQGGSFAPAGHRYAGELIRREEYFFEFPDGSINKFTPKKKSVIAILKEVDPSFSSTLNDKEIKDIEDVINVFENYK